MSERPPFKVADLSLAAWGRKEIEIADLKAGLATAGRITLALRRKRSLLTQNWSKPTSSATCASAPSSGVWLASRANSSPPHRATQPTSPTWSRSVWATCRSTESPTERPSESLMRVKLLMSRQRIAAPRSRRSA